MKPFYEFELSDVIKTQWEKVKDKIDRFTNEVIMANDVEVLAENIYQEFYIEPITLYDEDFSKRTVKQQKIKRRVDPFIRVYYENDYVIVDGVSISFYFPFTGDERLLRSRASTFSVGVYPEIVLIDNHIAFVIEKTLSEMKAFSQDSIMKEVEDKVKSIKAGIEYSNADIIVFNKELKRKSLEFVKGKRASVELFYDISKKFDVPINKTEYAKQIVSLERRITPISKKYKKEDYYTITDENYNDILSCIKHTASTYERTPKSYKCMDEEALRNTLLASLNATFKGAAVGEAFRNKGKTDICIEQENRAAFVAECKMWKGRHGIKDAIKQLDGYLTWRDCKTALIYFSRNKNFMDVLTSMKEELKSLDSIKSLKENDKNEFDCLAFSETNPGQKIQIRVLVFNLYSE